MLDALVQKTDCLRVGALLGAKHIGRAGGAVHGVVDVAHGHNLHTLQAFVPSGHVDAGNLVGGAAGGHKVLALIVVELHAHSGRRAAAAVVGGAAAQAHDDLLHAPGGGGQNQLSHAVGGGPAGVLPVLRQGQTRAGGHLHDGGLTAVNEAVKALHLLKEGVLDGDAHLLAPQGGKEAVHAALAAVGHGDGHHLAVREVLGHPAADDLADPGGGQGALEGVGNQDHFFHIASP